MLTSKCYDGICRRINIPVIECNHLLPMMMNKRLWLVLVFLFTAVALVHLLLSGYRQMDPHADVAL